MRFGSIKICKQVCCFFVKMDHMVLCALSETSFFPGSHNLYPKSSISYKLRQKCSHKMYVQLVFTYKIPKQITNKFYRADLLTVSDHTLSGKEEALLVYRDPVPCFHQCSDSL